ncbi:TRAP transporter substrate-binding protein [Ammoniphilus resinae]|uniref:Tripartite ATP-independent transporter DctP family solute receptor n=1 Tax=Ammoniphilus resinae TaxID=861532 RepID=A0ABS4GQY9_9BACL|nr:TRAP transporter substrate-binding protein [Ammoniphilus resinae]MBP1932661.1 tripartite ATP-independent transporter DctP family solute receptor [Ammoniphilus resinae]
MKVRKGLSALLAGVLVSAMALTGCGAKPAADNSSNNNSSSNQAAPAPEKKEVKKFKFGYDQPDTTGYGIAANIFNDKLKELSGGTMEIEQFPAAQLGSEPQMLQKIRSGDLDFMISSTANASTVAPQSGVFSLHYIFKSEEHLKKVLADPGVLQAYKDMVSESVDGGRILTLMTLGLRDIYSKKEIKSVKDLEGFKIRVQATPTEDAHFPAYGAQTVHMPFGEVYTSIQTGVMDGAENGVNVYLSNKHYEVGPVLSMTEHEANNSLIWVSDKVWNSLSDEEKKWVEEAAAEVGKTQPEKAFELEHQSQDKLKSMGVTVVEDVDKSGFIEKATPIQDQLAKELGPHAEKILKLVRDLE